MSFDGAMPMSRVRQPLLLMILAALVATIGVAMQHELAPVATAPRAEDGPALPGRALSADEQAYAAAMWPIHSETVETSAVAMSFAGVDYVTEHHDAHRLEAMVTPLHERFKLAAEKAQAMAVPASLRGVHDQYLEALTLYQEASTEMVKVAADGAVEHLVLAQEMSRRAAEDLLKVGDVLWPAEHKPN
jgi:hypothetical protein